MKTQFLSHLTPVLIAVSVIFVAPLASAQSYRAKLKDPKFEVIPSPDISTSAGKKFKPKDWLEMEMEIKVEVKPEPKSGYIDDVSVAWYVLVKNPEKNGTYLKLERVVKHANLEVGEDVYVSAYLSPATIRKISGSDKAGASMIEAVGAEVLINGRPQGLVTSKKFGGKEAWWNINSPKVAGSSGYKLLNKNETPFKFLWWDRYVEINSDAR